MTAATAEADNLAECLAHPEVGCLVPQAMAATAEIADAGDRARTLLEVAQIAASGGERMHAIQAVDLAMAIPPAESPDGVAELGYWLAAAQAALGALGVAARTAEGIADPDWRAKAEVEIAKAAADARDFARAAGIVSALADPWRQDAALALAHAYVAAGELARGQGVADVLSDPNERASVYAEAVGALVAADRNAEALAFAAAAADPATADGARAEIAAALAKAGDIAQAQAVLAQIADVSSRGQALDGIAEAQVAAGDLAGAQTSVAQVRDPVWRQLAEWGVIIALAEAGDDAAALDAAALAEGVDLIGRANLYLSIQRIQLERRDFAAARDTAERIADPYGRFSAGLDIADAASAAGEAAIAAAELNDAARRVAEMDPFDRRFAIPDFAVSLARAGDPDGAMASLEGFTPAWARAIALADVGAALAALGTLDKARLAFERAALSAGDVPDADQRRDILLLLAEPWALSGDAEGAAALLRTLDPSDRATLLAKLATPGR